MEFPLFIPFVDFQEASSWGEMSSKECWPFLIQAIPGNAMETPVAGMSYEGEIRVAIIRNIYIYVHTEI